MDEQTGLFQEKRNTVTIDEQLKAPAKIMTIGIGGIGTRSINHLIEAKIPGMEFIAIDTDIRELRSSQASIKFEIGMNVTRGAGCGGNPQLGRKIALEEAERLLDLFKGYDMVFLLGGEGGGTFTGAAPIFAGLASETGALTIAMATMPLSLQGVTRRKNAETGIQELKEAADALIAVSNEDLYHALDESVLLEDSFSYARDIFCGAVRDLAAIVTKPGILNLELSDMRAIMKHRGVIVIGTGVAEGSDRASEAAKRAITNPLLGYMPISEAKSVLMNVTGSRHSLRLHEAKSAAQVIEEQANLEDMVIGAMYDNSMKDRLKVTVIASGAIRDEPEPLERLELHIGTTDNVVIMERPAQLNDPSSIRNKTNWEELDQPPYRRRRLSK